jgi:hypothetical protein
MACIGYMLKVMRYDVIGMNLYAGWIKLCMPLKVSS